MIGSFGAFGASGMPTGMSKRGFAASSWPSTLPPCSTASTGAVYFTVDVFSSPVDVTCSVGWLTTRTVSSNGVPASSFSAATCIVDVDCTALFGEPGMSTSRTTDRADSVFGRLISEPLPSAVGLPDNAPPSVLSGPASFLSPSITALSAFASSLGASNTPVRSGVDGSVGIALSRERLAISVVASAIVPTHGPAVSLHLACTWPVSAPARTSVSSGDDGSASPLWMGFGLSGDAVCDNAPGACGLPPWMAMPPGAACAIDRSNDRYASELTCADASPNPSSAADCFGSLSSIPGTIAFVGVEFGRIRRIPSPVPASPTARPGGTAPTGDDIPGDSGSVGVGIGVVG